MKKKNLSLKFQKKSILGIHLIPKENLTGKNHGVKTKIVSVMEKGRAVVKVVSKEKEIRNK